MDIWSLKVSPVYLCHRKFLTGIITVPIPASKRQTTKRDESHSEFRRGVRERAARGISIRRVLSNQPRSTGCSEARERTVKNKPTKSILHFMKNEQEREHNSND